MKYVAIWFKNRLDHKWSAWFENLELNHPQGGGTIVSGYIEDFSALLGLLGKISSIGLEPVILKYETINGETRGDQR